MLVTKMICTDVVTNLIQEGQAHILFTKENGKENTLRSPSGAVLLTVFIS